METENALSSDALRQLTTLCAETLAAEKLVEEAEANLKAHKARYRSFIEEDIPAFLTEVGVKAITLTDGTKVTIKSDVQASIPKEGQEAAFTWLEANGFGGLIKTEVTVTFGREEAEAAKEFAAAVAENGREPELSRGVHHQTLCAFLREQLEKARPVPLELFGARPVTIAKLTPARARERH